MYLNKISIPARSSLGGCVLYYVEGAYTFQSVRLDYREMHASSDCVWRVIGAVC